MQRAEWLHSVILQSGIFPGIQISLQNKKKSSVWALR